MSHIHVLHPMGALMRVQFFCPEKIVIAHVHVRLPLQGEGQEP